MESKELIVTMLCYIGVLLEICIEYVINRCHYFGWYELGFNCCVFAMVLIVVLVVCWIYFLFVKGYTNNYMGLLPWVFVFFSILKNIFFSSPRLQVSQQLADISIHYFLYLQPLLFSYSASEFYLCWQIAKQNEQVNKSSISSE